MRGRGGGGGGGGAAAANPLTGRLVPTSSLSRCRPSKTTLRSKSPNIKFSLFLLSDCFYNDRLETEPRFMVSVLSGITSAVTEAHAASQHRLNPMKMLINISPFHVQLIKCNYCVCIMKKKPKQTNYIISGDDLFRHRIKHTGKNASKYS